MKICCFFTAYAGTILFLHFTDTTAYLVISFVQHPEKIYKNTKSNPHPNQSNMGSNLKLMIHSKWTRDSLIC